MGGQDSKMPTATTKASYTVWFGHVTLAFLLLWFIQIHGRCSGTSQVISLWGRRRRRKGGGGVRTAAGVIQYIGALHCGKRRRWKQRSEHAEIYGFGCGGAEVAASGAAGRLPRLLGCGGGGGRTEDAQADAVQCGAARWSHKTEREKIRQPPEV